MRKELNNIDIDSIKTITDKNDLYKLKSGEPFKFICKKCWKLYVIKNFKPKNINRYGTNICGSCLRKIYEDEHQEEYICSKNKRFISSIKNRGIDEKEYMDRRNSFKLKDGFIFVENIDDLKYIKSDETIIFNCSRCGNLSKRSYNHSDLLCQKCKNLLSRSKDNNKRLELLNKVDKNMYIFINDSEDLKLLRKGDRFRFICKQCGEIVFVNSFRYEWLDRYKKFLCYACNYDLYRDKIVYHKYRYNDEEFDSSWELAFYIYNKDHGIPIKRNNREKYFTFNVDGDKEYKYYPDFIINGNEYIEIKGDQFYNGETLIYPYRYLHGAPLSNEKIEKISKIFNSKWKCMCDNKVKVIMKDDIKPYLHYVDETYGKQFIQSLSVK